MTYAVKKYILGLLQHNNIFSYFTAISLHQEFRFNDIILMLPWHVVKLEFHCMLTFSLGWTFKSRSHSQ